MSSRLELGPASWSGETDVIIVGTGAAGLTAALGLLDSSRRVTVVTKGEPGDGSTAWAQGGLAAVSSTEDTVADHVADTLTAGAGLSEPGPVAALAGAAPQVIARLVAAGARFDRNADGTLALGLEGGHHHRRIVHRRDTSGAEVARVLTGQVRAAVDDGRLTLLEQTVAVDALLGGNGEVRALRVLDADGRVGELGCSALVLASGGIGRAWSSTTNPATATGDGLALALRAGALVRDVEFVQFHPTVLAADEAAQGSDPGRAALISEAVRGEGARLVDAAGRPVLAGVHPLGDLAPRDVVAAALHAEMSRTGQDHLFLDATGLGAAVWRDHFPGIAALCRDRGIDPVRQPIPVRPAQHYACGGVLADLDGRTTVPGLYAIGEVAATGVQGANRLASNSLTEALVAGDRLARLLADDPPRIEPAPSPIVDRLPNSTGDPVHAEDAAPQRPVAVTDDPRQVVSATMSRHCGVLRQAEGLDRARADLAALRLPAPRTRDDVETANLLLVARAVTCAAALRTESRGCHRRADHPEPRPEWRRHLDLRLGAGGELEHRSRNEQELAA